MSTLAEQVRAADERIRPHVPVSTFRRSQALEGASGARVWLKEDRELPTGSFKLRGAFHRLLLLDDRERSAGIVAASSGNHGAAVAYAASVLGIRARVYVPHGASPSKVDKIRSRGAEVVMFGTDGLDTELEARAAAARDGATYVSPYNDEAVMAGQGTAAAEMLRQGPMPAHVYVAVGGGGLIGGMAAYLASAAPAVEVIGVVPERSPVMAVSVRAGRIVEMPTAPTLSDGTAGGIEPGAITFGPCRDFVHRWVTIPEEEIVAAMRTWATREQGRIEGAAAVALAAMLRDAPAQRGEDVAVVICGGNITDERWRSAVEPGVPMP